MIYRVKVADDSQRAERGAYQQGREVLFIVTFQWYVHLFQHYQREKQRNEISEKRLLHRRQVARESHERAHPREAERRTDYANYTVKALVFTLSHLHRRQSFACVLFQARR